MPQITCQYCGRANEISVHKPASAYGVPWDREWRPTRTYADSARRPRFGDVAQVQPESEFAEATRDSPARAPSPEDFANPFKRALVIGTLGFFGSIFLGIRTPNVVFKDDFFWLGVITISSFGVSFVLFTMSSDASMWIREKIINRDLDNDGHVGKPDRMELVIKREDKDIEGDSWELGSLPAPDGQRLYLQHFCQAIVDGYATFSERGSRKKSKDPKKGATHFGYDEDLWKDLQQEFVDRGWAYWRNPSSPQQGTEFTAFGNRMIQAIADGETVP